MSVLSASDGFWLVFFAYTAAFAPWTAISATDFISAEWKTVKETRQTGYLHILLSFLPALYVVAYCVVQGIAMDFKEAMAAMIASLFAVLHMSRTLWGLWQLRIFRRWAEDSIEALKAMGIKYELYWDEEMGEKPVTAEDVADNILVNEKIIDNQIMHGDVHCFLKVGNIEMRTPLVNKVKVPKWLAVVSEYALRKEFVTRKDGTIKVPRHYLSVMQWITAAGILVCEAVLRIFQRKRERKLEQVPTEPVEVWVRWATAFASQGLTAWIREFDVVPNPEEDRHDEEISAMERLYRRGRYFAAEVVGSASLQLWPEMGPSYNGLSPLLWDWGPDSDMNDGRVVMQELFREAVSSGAALPFSTPHIEELTSARKRAGSEQADLSYSAYQEGLRKIVSELPVRFVDMNEIRKFSVKMLEWLTILLHLGVTSRRLRLEKSAKEESGCCNDFHLGGCSCFQMRSRNHSEGSNVCSGIEKSKNEDTRRNSQALSNLRAQLNIRVQAPVSIGEGAGSRSALASDETVVSAFPMQSKQLREVSNGNRLVTKVGEIIDVWLALVSGEQVGFVLEKLNPEWERLCLGPEEAGYVVRDECMKEKGRMLLEANVKLEKTRLERRIADENHRYRFLDQFVTFMGYRMESVRSVLASWVGENSEVGVDMFFEMPSGIARDSVSITADLSESLSALLTTEEGRSMFKRRSVQCRLIWELQNVLEAKTANDQSDGSTSRHADYAGDTVNRVEDNRHISTTVIMLFVLSFPSLHVSTEITEKDGDTENCDEKGCCCIDLSFGTPLSTKRTGEPEFAVRVEITPICGPQRLCIVANIKPAGGCELRLRGADKTFKWQWWRDAFLGRLAGFQQWQEQLEIESVELQLTCPRAGIKELNIATGAKFLTWKEWYPFRTAFCRFELEGEKLLRQPLITGYRQKLIDTKNNTLTTLTQLPVKRVEPVPYDDAEDVVLAHTCILIQDAILKDQTRGLAQDAEDEDSMRVLMSMAGREEPKRGFLLYEMISTRYGHLEALKKGLELGVGAPSGLDVRTRGPDILLSFVTSMLPTSSSSMEMSKEDQMRMRNEIIPICKQLLLKWGDRQDASGSILQVLLIHLASNPRDHAENMEAMMQLALFLQDTTEVPVRALHQISLVFDLIDSADAWRGRIRSLLVKAEDEMCKALLRENMRTKRNILEIAVQFGDALLGILPSGLEIQVQGVVNKKPAQRMAIRGLDRVFDKAEYFDALTDLSWLLVMGSDGVATDPVRSAQLSKRAITEGSHAGSMQCLAYLLTHGRGMEADPKQAVALYERAIEEGGGSDCIFALAGLLETGAQGVEANPNRAVFLYNQAIDEGNHKHAMNNLALLLENGADGVAADGRKAVTLYERAINEGNVVAMYNLGSLMLRGAEGVEINKIKAVKLFDLAVREGKHAASMNELARLLEKGVQGIEPDLHRAICLYNQAIEEGNDVDAMNNLALLLEKGADGVEADAKKAVTLYERAINGGNVVAMQNLGMLMLHGAEGVEIDRTKAVALFEQAVKEGKHAASMNELARLLENGAQGTEPDLHRAVHLYNRAIEEGNNVDAMNNLALLLEKGADGVEADAKKAVTLYERAINGGNVTAMQNLGMLMLHGAEGVEIDRPKAVALFERAVEEGKHAASMNELARLLENGAQGTEPDLQRAVYLYNRAIEEGNNVDAMNNLALLLEKGADGVEADAKKAVTLYERAINGGNVTAMHNLGSLLLRGAEGVEIDPTKAVTLFERAIDIGRDSEAMNELARLLQKGAQGIEPNLDRAVHLYNQAIEEGSNVDAMNNLALLLENGAEGVQEDAKKAVALYERAVSGGNVVGMCNLAFLLERGASGVEVDMERAVTLYERAIEEGKDVDAMYRLWRFEALWWERCGDGREARGGTL